MHIGWLFLNFWRVDFSNLMLYIDVTEVHHPQETFKCGIKWCKIKVQSFCIQCLKLYISNKPYYLKATINRT